MEIVNYWLDWTMSLSQLFNQDDYDQRTAMITDLRKQVNGDFDASQLLKRLNTVQKPFSADHWRFSSPAVMFGAAILLAVVTFAIGKKCCAQAQITAPTQTQLSNFQNQRPLFSFTSILKEGITSFFTVLFRTLDFTCTFFFILFCTFSFRV
jgi:hypothetical protein